MSNTNNSVSTTSGSSNLGSNIDYKLAIHVGTELLVISAMGIYFQSQVSKLKDRVSKLEEQNEELLSVLKNQDMALREHDTLLRQILNMKTQDTNNHSREEKVPPKSTSKKVPIQPPQKKKETKNEVKSSQKEVKTKEDLDDEIKEELAELTPEEDTNLVEVVDDEE